MIPANNAKHLEIRIKSLVISAIIVFSTCTFSCDAQNSPNQNSKNTELPDSILVSQCIMVAAGPLGLPTPEVLDLIKKGKVGGVLFLKEDRSSVKEKIDLFNAENEKTGFPKLIFASDAEPGLYGAKINGGVKTPWAGKFASVDSVANAAKQISEDLVDLGIHWNFAPVCDLNSNTSVIGIRSFGSDPEKVSQMANAFINESSALGVATTAKHFPGHGLVTGDTHKNLVFIDGSFKELGAFVSAMTTGVPSIMVGHIEVRNSKYQTDGLPASCAKSINKGLLRDSLKYKGVIVTDALNMGALSDLENPSLMALSSGADLALMPNDAWALHSEVLSKMKSSSDFQMQIRASAKRIMDLKNSFRPKD